MIVIEMFVLILLFFGGVMLIFRASFLHIFHRKKQIFLTFDDGPQPELTEQILKILAQESVKATFFCVGDCAQRCPELVTRIKQEGHSVGNHTMHHLNGWHTSLKDYIADVGQADKILKTNLFRPPYGKIGLRQWWYLRKKYRIVFWTAISYDWNQRFSPEKCLSKVKSVAKYGGIVVFHDNPKAAQNMLQTLPVFIRLAKKHNAQFKVFDEKK